MGARRPGTFTLALVKGDAGIGKSRLVRELEASSPLADALTLRGSCFPIAGEEAPYAPWSPRRRDAAGRAAGDRGGPPARGIHDRGARAPAARAPRGRQAPAGRDGSRGAQGRQYAVPARVARAAWPTRRRSCSIVEDTTGLTRRRSTSCRSGAATRAPSGCCSFATHRLHDGRDLQALERYVDQLERCPAVETITLCPLTEAQVSEQIRRHPAAPAGPDDHARRITARTQGNPFYVEELIAHGETAEAPLPAGQARHAARTRPRRRAPRPSRRCWRVLEAAFGRAIEHELLGGKRPRSRSPSSRVGCGPL